MNYLEFYLHCLPLTKFVNYTAAIILTENPIVICYEVVNMRDKTGSQT